MSGEKTKPPPSEVARVMAMADQHFPAPPACKHREVLKPGETRTVTVDGAAAFAAWMRCADCELEKLSARLAEAEEGLRVYRERGDGLVRERDAAQDEARRWRERAGNASAILCDALPEGAARGSGLIGQASRVVAALNETKRDAARHAEVGGAMAEALRVVASEADADAGEDDALRAWFAVEDHNGLARLAARVVTVARAALAARARALGASVMKRCEKCGALLAVPQLAPGEPERCADCAGCEFDPDEDGDFVAPDVGALGPAVAPKACGDLYRVSVTARCALPPGHDGMHRAGNRLWADDADPASGSGGGAPRCDVCLRYSGHADACVRGCGSGGGS